MVGTLPSRETGEVCEIMAGATAVVVAVAGSVSGSEEPAAGDCSSGCGVLTVGIGSDATTVAASAAGGELSGPAIGSAEGVQAIDSGGLTSSVYGVLSVATTFSVVVLTAVTRSPAGSLETSGPKTLPVTIPSRNSVNPPTTRAKRSFQRQREADRFSSLLTLGDATGGGTGGG